MQKSEPFEPLDCRKLECWYDSTVRALIFADAGALESLLATAEAAAQTQPAAATAHMWDGCANKREVLRQVLLKTQSNLGLLQRIASRQELTEYPDVCRRLATGGSSDPEGRTDVRREDSWPR